MYAGDKIINAMARAHDAMRDVFAPPGTHFYFLKRAGQTSDFTEVLRLETGVNVLWNDFRVQMEFRVATTDPAFADQIAQSSFIAYGVIDGSVSLDVYGFDQQDVVPPSFGSPFWKVFAVRLPTERLSVV